MSESTKAVPTLDVAKKSPDETETAVLARTVLRPTVNAASSVLCFQSVAPGAALEFSALVDELADQCKHVSDGNFVRTEGILMSQAHTLDAIFNNLLRRAAQNMGEYPDAVERYMKFALRAQSQCRATLETLADMKNPRPVAYVTQANIGQSVQVNNGPPVKTVIERKEESAGGDRELLPDPGTSPTALDADTQLEAVGALNGTSVPRG